jgi:NADH-ubiquinone oxidoreductase chain 5
MYLSIIFFPLFSSIISGFFGKNLGLKGLKLLIYYCTSFSFFISLFIFYETGLKNNICFVHLLNYIDSEFFSVSWGFIFDNLTIIVLVVITFISGLVHLYSLEYMIDDPCLPRFMSYLSLFTFFMLILVTSDNFIQMFVGWEGVGLCSYLLINFWTTRIQANKAAIKAMIVNRIGDFGLSLGLFTIYFVFNSIDYSVVFSLVYNFINYKLIFFNFEIHSLTLISLLLFVGAIGKSAQLGLHVWLPDAMEGPTPVSALIHAATMVTAGVFLLVRCSPIFESSTISLSIITFFGAFTCFFAASIGLVQNDLKRVIAYSTCSQLGYMIFACGLSNYSVSLFHLANHAFFKALLFLGAGSIIHILNNEQDMRKMGGLKNLIPFTYSIMLIGSFSLMGFPFLTGFYSKDMILEIAFANFSTISHFSYWLGSFSAFFTAFYSIRLIYLVFLTKCRGYRSIFVVIHDNSFKIILPLFLLVFPSIFIGYFLKDMITGFGTSFFENSLFVNPQNLCTVDSEFINIYNKLLPVILSIFGGWVSYFLYKKNIKILYKIKMNYIVKQFFIFFNKKWFFDKIYNEYINQPLLKLSFYITYQLIDKGFINVIGPYGLTVLFSEKSFFLKKFQNGISYQYILVVIVSILISITYFFIFNNNIIFNLLNFKIFIMFVLYYTMYNKIKY